MKVSVLMVTYNHERFIAQAIESALNQVTDFEYEIVMGEDASTDRTRERVKEYTEAYPTKVRAFFHPKNLGPSRNLALTYKACRGEYIAFLDGDDYWTDPQKLQRQAGFLDNHPGCTLCSHPAEVIYEDGRAHLWPSPIGFSSQEIRTIEDILPLFHRPENLELPPPCVMTRNGLIQEFPAWFYEVFNHDIAIQWLVAEHGKIGFVSECMAVHRKHGDGLSRLYETNPDFCWGNFLKLHLAIDRHFGYRYHDIIKMEIAEEWSRKARIHWRRGELGKALWAQAQSQRV